MPTSRIIGAARAWVFCLCGLACIGHATTAAAQLSAPGASVDVMGGWQLGVGVGASWFSNPLFVDTAAGAGVTAARLRVLGARFWEGRTDRLALSASGGLLRFSSPRELNSSAYDVSLLGNHQFSPRSDATVTARASRDLSNRGFAVSGDGVLLDRLVVARTEDVTASVRRQFTRAVGATVTASAQRIDVGDVALASGTRQALGVGVGRTLSRSTSITGRGDYQRSTANGLTAEIPQVQAALTQRLAARLSVNVAAGASFVSTSGDTAATGDARTLLNGAASLRYRANRTELGVSVERAIGQEFGRTTASVQVNDGAAITISRSLRSNWRSSAGANIVKTTSVRGGQVPLTSITLNVETQYTPRNGPTLSLSSFLAERSAPTRARAVGVTAGVGFGWSTVRTRVAAPGA